MDFEGRMLLQLIAIDRSGLHKESTEVGLVRHNKSFVNFFHIYVYKDMYTYMHLSAYIIYISI